MLISHIVSIPLRLHNNRITIARIAPPPSSCPRFTAFLPTPDPRGSSDAVHHLAMASAGMPVWIDAAHATKKGLAHNKITIIDAVTVITGRFIFTEAAESRNAENIFLVRDKSAATRYLENWLVHAGHSEAYMGR